MRKQANRGREDKEEEKRRKRHTMRYQWQQTETVSTGTQKTATTGLSTGSLGKGQQKEKLAEILAREAAPVLATLSTSIPSMNTHFFQGSDTI